MTTWYDVRMSGLSRELIVSPNLVYVITVLGKALGLVIVVPSATPCLKGAWAELSMGCERVLAHRALSELMVTLGSL